VKRADSQVLSRRSTSVKARFFETAEFAVSRIHNPVDNWVQFGYNIFLEVNKEKSDYGKQRVYFASR
jgi:hypothetical protein